MSLYARRLGLHSALVTVLACVACAVLVLAGCKRADEPAPVPTEPVEAPVPAPPGVVAEVAVASPNSSWSRLQRGIGGPLGLLPGTFAGAIFSSLGVDVSLASEVDANAPAHAVVARQADRHGWAIALHLADARHARAAWTMGDAAPLLVHERGAIDELTPRTGPSPDVTLGMTRGGFLVLASSASALDTLGPYVARNLGPRRPAGHAAVIEIPDGAFAGDVAPWLEGSWKDARTSLIERDERVRADHGGRAPDYGDPKAIVAAVDAALAPRLTLAREVGKGTISIDVGEGDLAIDARFAAHGALAAKMDAMPILPRDVLAALPGHALVVVAHRLEDDAGDAGAPSVPQALLDVVGERLSEANRRQLRALDDEWRRTKPRDVALAAWATEPTGVFVRAGVRDVAAAERLVASATELAAVPPFRDALHVAASTTRTVEVEGLGRATVAAFTRTAAVDVRARRAERRDGGADPAQDPFALAWMPAGDALLLGAGPDAIAVLRAGARPEPTLASSGIVAATIAEAGDASTVVVLQPLLLDAGRAPADPAPLTLVVGRADHGPRFRTTSTYALLREASRFLVGF